MPSDRTILIFNLRNVGHFTVYCHNFTSWALERGLNVVYCGFPADNLEYHAIFFDHPNVRFLDASPFLELSVPPGDDATALTLFQAGGTARIAQALRHVQNEIRPWGTVLINADEFFFNHPLENEGQDFFASPTWAVITFGFRDRYTGCDETYAWRLRQALRRQQPFSKILTIDEYHAAFEDPEQNYLIYLPDPYRPFHRKHDGDRHQIEALNLFLDSDNRPVLPVAGKFDARKNNLWLLEEVLRRPNLRAVVLGERVNDPAHDNRIDAVLRELKDQGRLFLRFGFVSHTLLELLFSSPRVLFSALPYLTHHGSSGLQLMAAEHDKPTLVPDSGLMGRRARDAGIGLIFRHGDQEDFSRQFARLAEGECAFPREHFERFKRAWGEALQRTVDYIFGLGSEPPAIPSWVHVSPATRSKDYYEPLNTALDLAFQGRQKAGLAHLDEAIRCAPGHTLLWLRRFAMLLRGHDRQACLMSWQHAADSCQRSEREFLTLRLAEYLRDLSPQSGSYDEILLFSLLPEITETAEAHRTAGDALVRRQCHADAENAYRRSLLIEPNQPGVLLSLSDVCRYQEKYVEGLEALNELESLSPDAPGLWCKRGQLWASQNRHPDARQALMREIGLMTPFSSLAQTWLQKTAIPDTHSD